MAALVCRLERSFTRRAVWRLSEVSSLPSPSACGAGGCGAHQWDYCGY